MEIIINKYSYVSDILDDVRGSPERREYNYKSVICFPNQIHSKFT